MSKQQGFSFNDPPPMPAHCPTTIAPRDPSVDVRDVPRLAGQNLVILGMLRSSAEVSNMEIANKSILKHTSRISDLRRAGYVVNARRGADGVWWYSLGTDEVFTKAEE